MMVKGATDSQEMYMILLVSSSQTVFFAKEVIKECVYVI
jgi:hypothetical protein